MGNNKQYIYIAQAEKEKTRCKIGKTTNLEKRLKTYNSTTGVSLDDFYKYLFACEVKDATVIENDIKKEFKEDRETNNREMYFYNPAKFDKYVKFIKKHKLFVEEISIKKDEPKIKIVKEKQKTLKERNITRGDILRKAKAKAKAIQKDGALSEIIEHDEFYTRYEDVEKEVNNYTEFFANKVVFCNCDDPYVKEDEAKSSAFALYFYKNFKKLKLKKLICTHYSGGGDLFRQGKSGIIYTNDGTKWVQETPPNYTGSFDDPLSLKILNEEADIICTNPPFSRARDYWKLVIDSGKKFLIISNFRNVVTTAYIKYFKNKQVQSGINRVDFYVDSKGLKKEAPGHWYTNFPITKHNSTVKLVPLKDIPEKDKRIDDKGILNINRCNIPNDYEEPIAVSVYPMLQRVLDFGFEIIQEKRYEPYVNGQEQGHRVLIQKVK
jgi:hypothetical protein